MAAPCRIRAEAAEFIHRGRRSPTVRRVVDDARSSVNGHAVVPNADGSVTIVVSRGMTDHPNSLTMLDYPRGNLAFRWFVADGVPARPEARLMKVVDAPTAVT